MRRLKIVCFTVCLPALLVACGGGEDDQPTAPDPPATPSEIEIASGDGQQDPVDHQLSEPLAVRVTGAEGRAVSGATVEWSVPDGLGSVSQSESTTDGNGEAEVRWTLGTTAGRQTVTASVEGAGEVEFAATALPGPPANVVARPDSDTIRVHATRILSVEKVVDQYGNEIDTATVNVEWESDAPTVATVNDRGIVRGAGSGEATVTVSAGAGTESVRLTVVSSPSVTGTRSVEGSVAPPAGVDTSSLYASTLIGGATRVTDGRFTVRVADSVPTAVSLKAGEIPLGIDIVPPGQMSAGRPYGGAGSTSSDPSTVEVTSGSTATALIYLTPPFARAPTEVSRELLGLIASQPETDELADIIETARREDGSLPGPDNTQYQTAVMEAYRAAVEATRKDGSQDVRDWLSKQDPWRRESGLVWTDSTFDREKSRFDADLQNRFVRWVSLYRHDADVTGNPQGEYNFEPWLVARPAEPCTGKRTTAETWVDDCLVPIAEGQTFPSGPYRLGLGFSKKRPRKVILGYGPGNSLRGSLEAGDGERYVLPTVLTLSELWVLPVASPLAGVGAGTVGEAATSETINDAISLVGSRFSDLSFLIDCLREDDGSAATACAASTLFHPGKSELRELFINVAHEVYPGLTELITQEQVRGATWVDDLNYWIQRSVGALGVDLTGAGLSIWQVFNSKSRVDFDFGYNRLLGATNITKDMKRESKRSVGYPGETLSDSLKVLVTSSGGGTVNQAWVSWDASNGNGKVDGVHRVVKETDKSGNTSVRWSLPKDTGHYTVSASLTGYADTVQFGARAMRWRRLVAGARHSCGVTEAGSIYCWGGNGFGQLGIDSITDHQNTPERVGTDTILTNLTDGYHHNCAVDTDGRAYCWGRNNFGQLGVGDEESRAAPTPISSDRTFEDISAGGRHTCGLTTDSTIYCWGDGLFGQLGNGSDGLGLGESERSAVPVRVQSGHDFESVSAGYNHTCALTAQGEAYCWGDNEWGQLGIGSDERKNTPTRVAGGVEFESISAGGEFTDYIDGVADHTCGISSEGKIYCWGDNTVGQLGDGTTDDRYVPTLVETEGEFSSVTAGGGSTCGRSRKDVVYCWGGNWTGKLGDGTTTDRHSPTRIAGDLKLATVTIGVYHACGVTEGGVAYCWGRNSYGQLGTGESSFVEVEAEPVRVKLPR